MKNREQAKVLVSQMTLEERAGMCSGMDCWNTKPVERLGIPSVMVSDGPHGLRKQINAQDNLGIGESAPATCFPTASLTACSFDEKLTYDIGRAIGEECLAEGVSVLLGPGINLKRSPLCGRNFEYYSEDPIVSAKMAAGMIKGVQSTGVGTSLKHFAVNNQERRRMNVSAVIDERTLHEIYLKAFELAVKEARPRTVMCSYNKINEVYASENKKLLTDILRDEWGYQGMVVSDWGAVHDRVEGVKAGLDLEMPGSLGMNDRKIVEAVKDGRLTEQEVDEAACNVVELVLDCMDAKKENASYDRSAHHALAVKAAEESIVLLKNEDGMLPIQKEQVAVIGSFAVNPRYQGAGSSKINPLQVDSPLEQLKKEGVSFVYAKGYENNRSDSALLKEACEVAKAADKVIFFGGLPENYESEGFDRSDMRIPEEQNRLIHEICKVNKNMIVVLMGGAPMELPWEPDVKAILLCYLGGEGIGTALAKVVKGSVVPSGKLAETWPLVAEDVPCADDFPGDRLHVLYREGVNAGYRYYDTVGKKVRFSFGHGLSYTDYQYRNAISKSIPCEFGDRIQISFYVKNIGGQKAKETSFAFVSHRNEAVDMPKHQLVGFTKEEYQPGEEKLVTLEIDTRNFGYYHVGIGDYYAEPGIYEIFIGSSLENLPLRVELLLNSYELEQPNQNNKDFEARLGYPIPPRARKACRPFTAENCLEDVKDTFVGKILEKVAVNLMGNADAKEEGQGQMMNACMYEMPFFALQASSEGLLTEKMLDGILDLLNGRYLSGIRKFLPDLFHQLLTVFQ